MKMRKADIEKHIKNTYNILVPDYWNKIENSDIPLTPQVENKKRRIVSFYRIVAIAACFVLILTVSLIGVPHLFGRDSNQSDIIYGQDTPVRIGKLGTIQPSFEKPYTFKEAYEEAELVAEVVITEWLGELDKDGYGETTYFKARIIEKFKNEINFEKDEITLLQAGNSKWTFRGYPLFKNGDKLLLSLSWIDPIEYSEFCSNKKDCFAIVGEQLTEMQVVNKDEKKYALKRNLYNNFTDIEYLMQPNATTIIENTFKQDEVLSLAGTTFECVYSVDDLKTYIDGLKRQ